jgi:hypothetical protein
MARACGQGGTLFMSAVGPVDSEGHQLGVPPLRPLSARRWLAFGLQSVSALKYARRPLAACKQADQSAKAMTPTLTKGAAMIIRKAVSAATVAVVASLAAAVPAAASYPPAIRVAFVHACVNKGSSLKGCDCLFSYVQSGETYKVFLNQASVYEKGGPIARIEITGAARCGLR